MNGGDGKVRCRRHRAFRIENVFVPQDSLPTDLRRWARICVFGSNVRAGEASGRNAWRFILVRAKHASLFTEFQGHLRRSEAV